MRTEINNPHDVSLVFLVLSTFVLSQFHLANIISINRRARMRCDIFVTKLVLSLPSRSTAKSGDKSF